MPKQRRAAASRSPARPVAKKSDPRKAKGAEGADAFEGGQGIETLGNESLIGPKAHPALSPHAETRRRLGLAVAARVRALTPKAPEPKEAPAPAPPPRRPAFYEALAVYETGVRALQRHDFAGRRRQPPRRHSRLSRRARAGRTRPALPAGLRAGDGSTAVRTPDRLRIGLRGHRRAERRRRRGSSRTPRQGPGKGSRERSRPLYYGCCPSRPGRSVAWRSVHLRQAITLNPENRSVALQDPDLGALHELDAFREALDAPSAASRRRIKARR